MKTLPLIILLFLSCQLSGQEISFNIEIHNLKSANGNVLISIFTDQKSFAAEIPQKHYRVTKEGNMVNGVFKTTLILPSGNYGCVMVDDNNNDGQMNYTIFGMPKEGFGFSYFYLSGFKRPRYEDFAFQLTDKTGTLNIRMRYL